MPLDAAVGPPRYSIVLPFETPTLNVVLRWHMRVRDRWKARAAWEIRAAIQGALPAHPIPYARVRIVRYGHGRPDHDGLVGGLKLLIDCLLPQGKPFQRKGSQKWIVPHPHGLGIIWDDSPERLVLDAESVRIARNDTPHTTLDVWEIPR